jgi:hypothetical protein
MTKQRGDQPEQGQAKQRRKQSKNRGENRGSEAHHKTERMRRRRNREKKQRSRVEESRSRLKSLEPVHGVSPPVGCSMHACRALKPGERIFFFSLASPAGPLLSGPACCMPARLLMIPDHASPSSTASLMNNLPNNHCNINASSPQDTRSCNATVLLLPSSA